MSSAVALDDGSKVVLEKEQLRISYAADVEKVLAPNGVIQDRVEKLAMDIFEFYQASLDAGEELHLVCVLKGSRGFFAALLKFLTRIACYSRAKAPPFLEHYARILVLVASLGPAHDISIVSENLECLRGKQVLVCEDMINTGRTLSLFCKKLQEYQPKSVKVAALLEKRQRGSPSTEKAFVADFCGFTLPSTDFVVGFSIDHEEKYRDLTHLCTLKKQSGRPSGKEAVAVN
eukprot:g17096.t1